MKTNFMKALITLFILALTLPACAPQVTVTPFVATPPTSTSLPQVTPTPATRSLKICLGEEPKS